MEVLAMFKYDDKVTLTAINAIDSEGNLLDYQISFPIDKDSFDIPENIREIGIFEYHEGDKTYGYNAFKICVGKITSIQEICAFRPAYTIEDALLSNIKSVDDKLCYYEDENGKWHIFAKLNNGDIVTDTNDMLRDMLLVISDNYLSIVNATEGIKRKSLKSRSK